eukprot:gene15836-17432_t
MAFSTKALWCRALPLSTSRYLAFLRSSNKQLAFPSIAEVSSKCLSTEVGSRILLNRNKGDSEVENPSNFRKIQYGVPKEFLGKVLGKEKQTVNEIKALSGSVIRLKKYQDAHDDPDKGYFIIGGNDEQIKKATDLIEQTITKKPDTEHQVQGEALIWKSYRRNFKGQFPPQRFKGKSVAGNPCPLCRLQLEEDREEPDLLKQFICPHTWKTLEPSITGLCQKQQRKLEDEIRKSKLYGLLPFTITIPDDSPIPHKPAGIPRKTARIRR